MIDWFVAAIAELLDNAVDEVTQISFMFYCVTEVVTCNYQHHMTDCVWVAFKNCHKSEIFLS